VDFVWNHPTVNQPSNFKNGQKGAIIEMFGWPYDDIAEECSMIGKAGYLGIKVFPPQ
jgi:alpha-amylase